MRDAIYWDTSALMKLYAPEPDSSDYLRLLIRRPEALAIGFLHLVELYLALCGKETRGEIAAGSAQRLFQLFEHHVGAGRYTMIPWGDDVAVEARRMLDASSRATPPVALRSLDGLHFGAMRAAKIQSLVTADARMREAARNASLDVVEP